MTEQSTVDHLESRLERLGLSEVPAVAVMQAAGRIEASGRTVAQVPAKDLLTLVLECQGDFMGVQLRVCRKAATASLEVARGR